MRTMMYWGSWFNHSATYISDILTNLKKVSLIIVKRVFTVTTQKRQGKRGLGLSIRSCSDNFLVISVSHTSVHTSFQYNKYFNNNVYILMTP